MRHIPRHVISTAAAEPPPRTSGILLLIGVSLRIVFASNFFEVHDVEDTLLPGRRGSAEAVQTRERNRRKDLIFVWVSTGQVLQAGGRVVESFAVFFNLKKLFLGTRNLNFKI